MRTISGHLLFDDGIYTKAERCNMIDILRKAWQEEEGQDIAEYAVMLAVILVLVVGTIRLIGSQCEHRVF